MTQMLERPLTTSYAPPALEPLGTLRSLTKGAGPGGKPVVMQTGLAMPSGQDADEPVQAAHATA
jgi:hypothetical protein